jgi:general secretion pathway protein I
MNARRPRRGRAFTLIEVLVSLAIFALAAVVLSAAYVNVLAGYRAHDQSREHEAAWNLARMAALTEADRAKVEAGGSLNLPDRGSLQWSAEIDPTTVADLFALHLHVEVGGNPGWNKDEQIMLYRPAWSDPGERDKLRADSRQRLTGGNRG